jgi:predicted secreted protein
MSSNAKCGQTGSVQTGTHVIAETSAWDLTLARTPTDVPKFGISREKILCGPYEWSGTITANWYMDDTLGQAALEEALKDGTIVTLSLWTDSDDPENPTTGHHYEGTVYISQVAISVPHDGIVAVTFNYVGSGDLSRN